DYYCSSYTASNTYIF
nr:immunoglobulin light chain junction region [Macaca mulatta]MOX17529.1 immunoglobulin light chain junction region [Macaca mulatta]MOX17613.1 immunoglobulin light chain junction region [Macaca mulatta]MOX18442.1 immunoglobulin light chain junction region [Macaca mulatta]MOX20172.1 immunoglobulin light chain junction region [Macaca mulatta]